VNWKIIVERGVALSLGEGRMESLERENVVRMALGDGETMEVTSL
jgi:hypothetical protein